MKRMISLLCLLGFFLSGCGVSREPAQVQFFAMDTVMNVTVYGKEAEEAARAVQSKINELDKLWSRTNERSEISRINACAGDGTVIDISPETVELLIDALTLADESGGAFNPLLAPVMDAWGFAGQTYRVPAEEELEEALSLAGTMPSVTWKDGGEVGQASLAEVGQKLDLGGIAKGVASDMALRILKEYDIDGALLDLGGNLSTFGEKPDGSRWKVGVKDPMSPQQLLCAFGMDGRTCATSGAYERYFEQDGEIYHHIIDPDTGYPADSDLISVTVVGEGFLADACSTAFFVMGAEKTLQFWRENSGGIGEPDLILVTKNQHVYITEGLEAGVDLLGEESGYTYEIVYR